MKIPMRILPLEYSDFNERIVVSVPAPAISGKAIGTIELLVLSGSSRNICTPKIISNPRRKITIDPATAKELTSTPNKPSKLGPPYRKMIMIASATILAFLDCILIPRCFIESMIGIDPTISITEKRTRLIENISLKFNSMLQFDLYSQGLLAI